LGVTGTAGIREEASHTFARSKIHPPTALPLNLANIIKVPTSSSRGERSVLVCKRMTYDLVRFQRISGRPGADPETIYGTGPNADGTKQSGAHFLRITETFNVCLMSTKGEPRCFALVLL
jgi:hypothetical protein